MTYDMRVRQALKFTPTVATNLGFVFIDDASIAFVRTNRSLGYRYGLYWPRQVYGRLVEELAAQGARAVALDIIFGELRPDHPPVRMADGRFLDSDEFFALQMRRASNVILAVPKDLTPPPLFLTNALALGDISTHKDYFDGKSAPGTGVSSMPQVAFRFSASGGGPGIRGGLGSGARGIRPSGLASPRRG